MGMAARPAQVERVGRETGNGSYEVVGCGRWPLLVAAAKYLDAYHGRRRVNLLTSIGQGHSLVLAQRV